jgi:hypothetical protein
MYLIRQIAVHTHRQQISFEFCLMFLLRRRYKEFLLSIGKFVLDRCDFRAWESVFAHSFSIICSKTDFFSSEKATPYIRQNSTESFGLAVKLWTCIRAISVSHVASDFCRIASETLSINLQFFQANFCIDPISGHTYSFQILYNSLFTTHSSIRRYISRATERVLEQTTNTFKFLQL